MTRLLIHGTLHLLGYDHQREEEARAMQAVEDRLRAVVLA
jgi:rRNA maturation RNase YbeY